MKKVLIIEPNENHLNIFAGILRRKFYQVVDAKHFIVAKFNLINSSIDNLPDLIIVGYGISFDNTLEIIDFIHKNFYFANIKIFKLCPSKTNETGLMLLDAGADDYMCLTEFSAEKFIFKIANVFSKINKLDNAARTGIVRAFDPVVDFDKSNTINYNSNKVNWNQIKRLIPHHDLERKLKKAAGAKAIPFIVTELLSLTSSINSDIKELIHFIELDPGLTARVLRCANSAYYRGNKGRIYNLLDAVKTMGFNGLKDLVLSIGILDSFSKSNNSKGLDRMKLWYHSLTVGVLAREIAILLKHNNPDYFFISGILHDLGTALFDDYFPAEYLQVLSLAGEYEVPITTAESKMLGMDHCEIAGNILKTWGFPDNILNTINKHHKSFSEILDSQDKYKQEISIIKLADCLTKYIGAGLFDYDEFEDIPNALFSFLNLDVHALDDILIKVTDNVNELIMVMLLHVDPSSLTNCNSFSSRRLCKTQKILIFNKEPEHYPSYEMLFKKLNYTTTSNKNLFNLPECTGFDFMMLDFPDENDMAQYITILKKIKTRNKEKTKVYVVTTEKIINTFCANKDISDNIVYILKPVSLLKIFAAMDKLTAFKQPQRANIK